MLIEKAGGAAIEKEGNNEWLEARAGGVQQVQTVRPPPPQKTQCLIPQTPALLIPLYCPHIKIYNTNERAKLQLANVVH